MPVLKVSLSVLALAALGPHQPQDDALMRLKDPRATERSAALVSLRQHPEPDAALLALVADSLFDDVEDVRVTAAYSVSTLAGKLGCNLALPEECQTLVNVFDAIPRTITIEWPHYWVQMLRGGATQAVISLEFLVRADGSVDKVRYLDGPKLLREPTKDAAKRWKFEPARRRGQKVLFVKTVTMRLRSETQ